MNLHLGGHLSWYAPQRAAELEIELAAPTPLVDIPSRPGLAAADIDIGVNGLVRYVSDGSEQILFTPRKDVAGLYDASAQSLAPYEYEPYGGSTPAATA